MIDIVTYGAALTQPWAVKAPKDMYILHKPINADNKNHFDIWLTFIIDNYESLNDYVLFLRENPLDFSTFKTEQELVKAMYEEPCLLYDRTQWLSTFRCNGLGAPHHNGLPVEQTFKLCFPDKVLPKVYEFLPGGQVMFSKTRIKGQPLSFYQKIKHMLDAKQIDSFAFERVWPYI